MKKKPSLVTTPGALARIQSLEQMSRKAFELALASQAARGAAGDKLAAEAADRREETSWFKLGERNSLPPSGVVKNENGKYELGIIPRVLSQLAVASLRKDHRFKIGDARKWALEMARKYHGDPKLDWDWHAQGAWLREQKKTAKAAEKREDGSIRNLPAILCAGAVKFYSGEYDRCRSPAAQLDMLEMWMVEFSDDPKALIARARAEDELDRAREKLAKARLQKLGVLKR